MKPFRIIFILLFLIISMGVVSAQDNLTDTLQDDIPATDEIGTFEELENDISNANSTLEITKDYRNDNYPDGIRIARDNLVINGNNHTIDGNGQNIFLIRGSNITINNLVFKNAYYDFGGAIYNGGELALNNVTFSDNGAGSNGGAIYNGGELALNNVTFADNGAGSKGGAIINWGVMDLNNVSFVDNCAGELGGAIMNRGVMDLNNVSFVDNCAERAGGAVYIYCDGEMDLNNVSFVDNSAGELGGAIFVDGYGSLEGCSFVGNVADQGGAVYIDSFGEVDLNNASFVDNDAAGAGGAVMNWGVMDLNNVSFVGNGADSRGGAIDSYGFASLSDGVFVDNDANEGSAIRIGGSEFNIRNTLITSKESGSHGQIYSEYSIISIDNLTVANATSNYSSAIHLDASDVSIVNSRFVNLTANVSAGAISTKYGGNLYIRNCEFINISSSKNAGVLHADILEDEGDGVGNVTILDSLFRDTCSGFGGAIIQLGGSLLLNNSSFIKNSATFDGGAAYLSHVDALINGCTFDSDSIGVFDDYPTYGGAIYFDYGNLTLNNSRFINTSSYSGSGAICIYDSLYEIANSTFGDGEAVHAIFKREGSKVIDCSGNFTICDENVFYPYVVVGEGMNLTPIADDLEFDSLPARFDLRDYNWTSPAKYQGLNGACWAFAAIGALESALLKSFGLSFDLSENNMQDTMLAYSKYGLIDFFEGGFGWKAAAYCLSWLGAVSEEADAYDDVGKISPIMTGSGNIHVQDVVFNQMNHEIANGDSSFKQAILKYGGLACVIYGFRLYNAINDFYNTETYAQYAYNVSSDHMVCVVGWDDAFSRENFIDTPPDDGAWICKNSWGSDFGDEGYFYVSYYDTTLCAGYFEGVGFLFENTIPYNKNYQYDVGGVDDMLLANDSLTYLNEFESCGDDLIAAVGTYFNSSGVEYTVEIMVNGELVYSQTGISPFFGYHTIKLDKYIPIKKGDKFSAAVTSNAVPVLYFNETRVHYTSGLSFLFYGGELYDLYDEGMIACLKVYTVADDGRIIDNRDIQVDYGKKSEFGVRVVTADGHAVVGADVDFTINGKTVTVKTGSDGTAKIEIYENPGVYVLTTRYNNQTCQNKVIVKSKSPDEKNRGDNKNRSDDKRSSDVNADGSVASNPTFYAKTARPYFQPIIKEDVVISAKNVVVSQKEFSKGYSYKITLKSKSGKLLANKKVIIIFNGMIFIGYTDENGTVCFNLTRNMTGLFNITIIFEGDDYYSPIAENRTIRIE